MRQIILIFFLYINFITLVDNQCCQQFDTASKCIECPSGLHLFRNNCIYDIPNCASHINGFSCQRCETNYILTPDSSSCTIPNLDNLPIPSNGFRIYPQNLYSQEPFTSLLSDSQEKNDFPIDIFAVLFQEQESHYTFRIIFLTDLGFLQNTYSVLKSDNSFKLRQSDLFQLRPQEQFFDIFQDQNFEAIKKEIEKNSQFSVDSIVDAFLQKGQSSCKYRLFLLQTDIGLVEIEVVITNSQTQRVIQLDPKNLNNIEESAKLSIISRLQELKDSDLIKAIKRVFGDKETYEYTFKDRVNQNQLFIRFQIDLQNTSIKVLDVQRQIGDVIPPPQTCRTSSSKKPITNMTLEEMPIINAIQSQNYLKIRQQFLFIEKQELFKRGEISYIAVGENETKIIYKIDFQTFDKSTINELLIQIDKTTKQVCFINERTIQVKDIETLNLQDPQNVMTINRFKFISSAFFQQVSNSDQPNSITSWKDAQDLQWVTVQYQLPTKKVVFIYKVSGFNVDPYLSIVKSENFIQLNAEEDLVKPENSLIAIKKGILQNMFFPSVGIPNLEFYKILQKADNPDIYRLIYKEKTGDQQFLLTYQIIASSNTFNPTLISKQLLAVQEEDKDQESSKLEIDVESLPQIQMRIIGFLRIIEGNTLSQGQVRFKITEVNRIEETEEKQVIEVIFETKKKKIVFEVALMKKNGQILITEKTLSDIKQQVIKEDEKKNMTKTFEDLMKEYTELFAEVQKSQIPLNENNIQSFEVKTEDNITSLIINDNKGVQFIFQQNQIPFISTKNKKPQNIELPDEELVKSQISKAFRLDVSDQGLSVESVFTEIDLINHLTYEVVINNTTYLVKFDSYGSVPKLISISSSVASFGLSSQFTEPKNASQEVKNFIKNRYGQRVSIKSEQRKADDNSIVRVYFNLYTNQGIKNIQVQFNIENGNIMNQYFLSEGFKEEGISNQKVREVNEFVLEKLKDYSLGEGVILNSEIRQIEDKGQVKIFYEFDNSTIFARVAFDGQQKTILDLEDLKSNLQKLKEENIANGQLQKRKITEQQEFKRSEDILFKFYKHYLTNASIVSVKSRQLSDMRLYTVYYQKRQGFYKALLLYDYQEQMGRVVSFGIPNSLDIPSGIINCVKQSQERICLACEFGYYLARDKRCYLSSQGCVVQSGEVCTKCEQTYTLSQNFLCQRL